MYDTKETLSKVFFAIADALESMDKREFEQLLSGQAKLRVMGTNNRKKSASTHEPCLDGAVADIARKLRMATSRESAADLLVSIDQPRRKDFLQRLARSCGVRVDSKDSIARIEQNLIENVVGLRLDSEAIKKVAF